MFIFRRFLPRCHAASDQRSHMRTWAGEEIAKLMMRIMRSQCLSWCATCAPIQALGQIQAAGFDGALKSLEQQHLFVELYSIRIRGICGKILLSVFGPQLDLPYVTMVPPICLKLSECPACCHSIKGKDIPTESSLVMTWECSRMS